MTHNCIKCDVPLVVDENITQCEIDHYQYICRSCRREHAQEYRQSHREQLREYDREYNQEYRQSHREQIQEYGREYFNKHHDRVQEHHREYLYRTGRSHPMGENRGCPLFLGVHVAEQVLALVFNHVNRMPNNNPGYDFICGNGYKIDVKSACRSVRKIGSDRWEFHIGKNQIAEYFLCLAFDNRDDLNPEHIWLIPAMDVNNYVAVHISESRIDKWNEYELDVAKVSACCNIMRGGKEHE